MLMRVVIGADTTQHGLDFTSSRTRKPISSNLVIDVMFVMSENLEKRVLRVHVFNDFVSLNEKKLNRRININPSMTTQH